MNHTLPSFLAIIGLAEEKIFCFSLVMWPHVPTQSMGFVALWMGASHPKSPPRKSYINFCWKYITYLYDHVHLSPFILQKNYVLFSCVTPYLYQHISISLINNTYLYQHFIDFRININKHKSMKKFENVYSKM